MEQAYAASGVRTTALCASNFIEPHGTDDSMAPVLMRRVRKGHISTPGNPVALQAYAYLPDWARAAVMLADRRARLDSFADIHFFASHLHDQRPAARGIASDGSQDATGGISARAICEPS